jgi:hypothetical protein
MNNSTEDKVTKVNQFLHEWHGAYVEFNHYHPGMADVFGISLQKEDGESIGFRFVICLYVQGPTRWAHSKLKCAAEVYEGEECFVVTDENVGFKAIAANALLAGEGELEVGIKY